MAKNTKLDLRGQLMYSVFVRNHTKEGTFRALEGDLDRIAALGTDIIWLMPIHPIGKVERKGELGSPYAISDYRGINPEYGTKEDLIHLVQEIHNRGMKCIIDVVYNHTAPDSVLADIHPEYFFCDADGHPSRHVADWWDIVDLQYTDRGLWDYQIETLKMWAGIVDGFRCDVASMVPVDFWCEAREAVAQVNPECIWLAESVFQDHVRGMRAQGAYSATDSELYAAFDITYPYDVWDAFDGYFNGTNTLGEYIRVLNFQEGVYPGNYVKLRCLENHDQPRFAGRVESDGELRSWMALSYFERGTTMLYAGEEFGAEKAVGLFDKDDNFGDMRDDWQAYLKLLRQMKRKLPVTGEYRLDCRGEEFVVGKYNSPEGKVRGIFSMKGASGDLFVDLPDGVYRDLVDGREVAVCGGFAHTDGEPVIIAEEVVK